MPPSCGECCGKALELAYFIRMTVVINYATFE
jgi:hypothetical protein